VSYKVFAVEDDPALLSAVTDLIADRGYMLDTPWQNSAQIRSFRFGTVRVDFQKSEIVRSGNRVALSERENRLLQFLVLHRGAPVSRDMLLEHVWGYRMAPLTRTVDVTIRRLRQKIETIPDKPKFIITVPGVGYRFRRQ
jgi:DNA-binding response OmpR family regulator